MKRSALVAAPLTREWWIYVGRRNIVLWFRSANRTVPAHLVVCALLRGSGSVCRPNPCIPVRVYVFLQMAALEQWPEMKNALLGVVSCVAAAFRSLEWSLHAGPCICRHGPCTTFRKAYRHGKTKIAQRPRPHKSWRGAGWYWRIPG